ncbi:MAG: thymidine phosphorylase [Lysobacterales bacterium]
MHATAQPPALPQELLRRLRLGQALNSADIQSMVAGISDGSWGDAQVGALAMAICTLGLGEADTTRLTLAMRDSGRVLDWHGLGFDRPVLDKHSTGGVGDLVSLMLAPMLAACGAYVPMLSGRGLGHTGGTLDKLEAIPGYQAQPDLARFRQVVRETGLAIVGAGADLAPADRRLYGIRDVTGTVESLPLITASILSKKLAAGTDALLLDIKTGNGASMSTLDQSRSLARSLVQISTRAGLPARALITDMSQPLAPAVGNALELRCALDYLRGDGRPERLHRVNLALGSELLCLGGLASDPIEAEEKLLRCLEDGSAAERFARMVTALGGPSDLLDPAAQHLPAAAVVAPVFAASAGRVSAIDCRRLGMLVVALGGGRTQPDQSIDHAVGLSEVAELGSMVDGEHPLAIVHAGDAAAHARAAAELRLAYTLTQAAPTLPPLIYERIEFQTGELPCAVPG